MSTKSLPTRISHADRLKRRRRMAKAVKRGQTVYEVAGDFGVTINTVRNACQEAGVPTTTDTTKPADKVARNPKRKKSSTAKKSSTNKQPSTK
jgi:transposase-like protein